MASDKKSKTDSAAEIPAAAAIVPEVMPAIAAVPARKPVEDLAVAKGHGRIEKRGKDSIFVPTWHFLAAKAHERWPLGLELSEAEYDQAVAAATGATLR
jgi:hypothetical protein